MKGAVKVRDSLFLPTVKRWCTGSGLSPICGTKMPMLGHFWCPCLCPLIPAAASPRRPARGPARQQPASTSWWSNNALPEHLREICWPSNASAQQIFLSAQNEGRVGDTTSNPGTPPSVLRLCDDGGVLVEWAVIRTGMYAVRAQLKARVLIPACRTCLSPRQSALWWCAFPTDRFRRSTPRQ